MKLVPYGAGDKLIYSCDEGFSAQGITSLICGLNGQWSNTQPSCLGD